MRPDSHIIGELQRKLESLENKYQLRKHAGTPSVNPIGIPTPKPQPRVRAFGVPAREQRVAGRLPGFGFPSAEGEWSCMRSDDRGFRGRAQRGVGPVPTRDTSRLAWGVIGSITPGWTSTILRRTMMVCFCHGWCFSCLIDKDFSRMELGFRNKSCPEFFVELRLMKFAENDLWTPRSAGKSHNL